MKSEQLDGPRPRVIREGIKDGPEAEIILRKDLPARERHHAVRFPRGGIERRRTRQDLPEIIALPIVDPQEVEDRVARLEPEHVEIAVRVDGEPAGHRLVEVVGAVGHGEAEGGPEPRPHASLERAAARGPSKVVVSIPVQRLRKTGLEGLGRRVLPSEDAGREMAHHVALGVDDRHLDVGRLGYFELHLTLREGEDRQQHFHPVSFPSFPS